MPNDLKISIDVKSISSSLKIITKAYTEILHFFMESSSTKDFDKLLREFPRLKFSFKNLVKTHYGYNILKEHRTQKLAPLNPILYSF